jgi:hypothetical protein
MQLEKLQARKARVDEYLASNIVWPQAKYFTC